MISLAILVSLFFFYSLVSRRLEQTIITAPIVFTVAGMLMFPALPLIQGFGVNASVLSWLAEIGLVLLLFTDASRTSLSVLLTIGTLAVRLLSVGMLTTPDPPARNIGSRRNEPRRFALAEGGKKGVFFG